MAEVKVIVGEIDGVELDDKTERVLDLYDCYYDNSVSGLGSSNGKDALDELTATVNAIGGAFGQLYNYYSSDGVSQTTDEAYVDKLNVTTPTLTAGRYLFHYSCELSTTSNNKRVSMQALVDGVQVGESSKEYMKSEEYLAHSGFYEFTISTDRTVQLQIQFGKTQNQATGQIRRARMYIHKVGL